MKERQKEETILKPMVICIEDINNKGKTSRFTSCVALPGRQPGLRLDSAGNIPWRCDGAAGAGACELWVSADKRLILYRKEDAPPVIVHRAGRSLNVPYNKPVVLVNQDQIDLNNRQLKIHLHGEASKITAPVPLSPDSDSRLRKPKLLAQGAALAAIIGALAVSGGCIEVRENPPVPLPPDDPIEEELENPDEQQSEDLDTKALKQKV